MSGPLLGKGYNNHLYIEKTGIKKVAIKSNMGLYIFLSCLQIKVYKLVIICSERVSYDVYEGRTGKYWPEVVTVRIERRASPVQKLRTKS